ncbi:hypothetical protein ONZ45_g1119 [Pleurotus djamor]|nr:hypothetical protein ONZ45_g1119 [Pleurotus djamor]
MQCKACQETEATRPQLQPFKRCSGCSAVYYCTKECQKTDWIRHVFDCNGQTITAAHHLALAVLDHKVPLDGLTLNKFGFNGAANYPAQSSLLYLYGDLNQRLSVSMKTIQSWAERKALVEEISAVYEKLPVDSRGEHYYWFLANQSILKGSTPDSTLTQTQPGPFQRRCNFCRNREGDDRETEWGVQFSTGPLKKCSGCKSVWYCSAQCQKHDWTTHKFDCKPKQGVKPSTADYLALAIEENLLPEDPQTCDDFGFTRAGPSENRVKLLGVYIGLIERMGIPAKEVSRWKQEGRLLDSIRHAFEQLPVDSRGGYFPWLMQNKHILQSDPLPDSSTGEDYLFQMGVKAFKYAGLVPQKSREEHRAVIETLPKDRATCLLFCIPMLSRNHPGPGYEHYISFGFCACKDEGMEGWLGTRWIALLQRCSFDELCKAYQDCAFLRLFESHGLAITDPAIIDLLLHSPLMNKSVWNLKSFVFGTDDSELRPVNSVWADYGFMNCTTDDERLELKSLYKAVLRKGAPLELHKACLAGKIYDYVGGYYDVSRRKKYFKRLLKNVYPLPNI